jgi:hypothetical protein
MSDATASIADAITDAQAAKLIAAATGKRPAAKATNKALVKSTTEGAPRSEAERFRRSTNARPVITFESAARLVPTHEQVANIVRSFGLDDVDYHAIREAVEESVGTMGKALRPALVSVGFDGEENAKGLEMHMQRIVGAFVGSAHGAASFYETKRNAARELNSQFNADREEDRMGVDGMANRAQRAREFAASLGLKAYATLAAADGALAAYEHLIGSPWKPYEGQQDNGAALAREAAASQASALGF